MFITGSFCCLYSDNASAPNLKAGDFSLVDEEFKRVVRSGKYLISVGSSSPLYGAEKSEQGILKKIIELI